jgi:hypothetical protein
MTRGGTSPSDPRNSSSWIVWQSRAVPSATYARSLPIIQSRDPLGGAVEPQTKGWTSTTVLERSNAAFFSALPRVSASSVGLSSSVSNTCDAPSAAANSPHAPVPLPSSSTRAPCSSAAALHSHRQSACAGGHSEPPVPCCPHFLPCSVTTSCRLAAPGSRAASRWNGRHVAPQSTCCQGRPCLRKLRGDPIVRPV